MTDPTPQPGPLFSDLFKAARAGHTKTILRLIEQGADPRQCHPTSGMTALIAATFTGHLEAVKILLPLSDPLQQNEFGSTALMLAAQEDHPEHTDIYFALLPHSDPRMTDRDGGTLLHFAASSGKPEIVKSALTFCDPNACDNRYGNTPLHTAAIIGSPCHILSLLATPENLRAKNHAGHTPLDICQHLSLPDHAATLAALEEQHLLQHCLPSAEPARPQPKL